MELVTESPDGCFRFGRDTRPFWKGVSARACWGVTLLAVCLVPVALHWRHMLVASLLGLAGGIAAAVAFVVAFPEKTAWIEIDAQRRLVRIQPANAALPPTEHPLTTYGALAIRFDGETRDWVLFLERAVGPQDLTQWLTMTPDRAALLRLAQRVAAASRLVVEDDDAAKAAGAG